MERSNSGIFVILLYVLIAVYMLPLYPEAGSADELTDWATTVALVENNSLNIQPVEKQAGIKVQGPVEIIDGGKYSTKAPGIPFLAAPFYAITRTIIGGPSSSNMITSWFVLKLLFGTLPLIALAVWLYSREVDSYSLAALLFATPMLPYSLLFFPHVFAAILVYMAFRLLYDGRRVYPETCFIAALILGTATACEYTVAVPAAVFGAGLFFTEPADRARRLLFFMTGIVPPAIGVAVYNYLVFGTPLAFLYHAEVAAPSLYALYAYLISPSLGIFVFSPVLLLGGLALFGSNERGSARHNVKVTAVLVTIVLVSGIGVEFGGYAAGPRHMILIMPLLLDSFFDGEIEEYPSFPRGLIFAVSFISCVLPVLTYPFASPELQFPHNSFWMPLVLGASAFAPTLANYFGFAASLWTFMPAVIGFLVVAVLVWRDSKYPVRFGLGTLVGFAFVAGYLFLTPLETETAKPLRNEATRIISENRLIN